MVLESWADYGNYGFAILRLSLAAIFLYHAFPKLKMPGMMAQGMGWPSSAVVVLGLVESLGALSVLLGIYARIGAIALAVVMLGAIYHKMMKWNVPFSAQDKTGWEFDLILFASAVLIATVGPGAWILFG